MKKLSSFGILEIAAVIGGVLLLNKLLRAKVGIVMKPENTGTSFLAALSPEVDAPSVLLPETGEVLTEYVPPVVKNPSEVVSPINTLSNGGSYVGSGYQNNPVKGLVSTNDFFI